MAGRFGGECFRELPKSGEGRNQTIASLGSAVHFVGKASELRSQILSALSKHKKNTFTGKEIGKNVSIIISIDGDDSPEISSLKNRKIAISILSSPLNMGRWNSYEWRRPINLEISYPISVS